MIETLDYSVKLEEAVKNITYGNESFNFISWAIYSAAIIICIYCCLVSAKYFSNDDYWQGEMALIGAAIAGSAPQIAKLFLY